jgi:hypothetical protein
MDTETFRRYPRGVTIHPSLKPRTHSTGRRLLWRKGLECVRLWVIARSGSPDCTGVPETTSKLSYVWTRQLGSIERLAQHFG